MFFPAITVSFLDSMFLFLVSDCIYVFFLFTLASYVWLTKAMYKNMVCSVFYVDMSSLLCRRVDSYSVSNFFPSSVPSAWHYLTLSLHFFTNAAIGCWNNGHVFRIPRKPLLLYSFSLCFLSFLHSVILLFILFLELQRKVS